MLRGTIVALSICVASAETDKCTTILVDSAATRLGATIVTHNNDCQDCDFRLARVEAGFAEKADVQLVRKCKSSYPQEVGNRSQTWSLENLEFTTLDTQAMEPPFANSAVSVAQQAWTTDEWFANALAGEVSVSEVEELADRGSLRFGSLESSYGIMNDAGLAIGESTCESQLVGLAGCSCPDCPGPLFDASSLTKIAMHFCDTAVCAVRMIGGLAEKHGFYGEGAEPISYEAGEALSIADGSQVWLLHLSPDETGLSAVWVAAKLPRGHVAVVANQFRLRGVPSSAYADSAKRTACLLEQDLEGDCEWLASLSLHDVAERSGLAAYTASGELDFAKSFGTRADNIIYPYATRRVWKVHSVVAPTRTKSDVADRSGKADYLGSEFEWSVLAERRLDLADLLALNRDYFEGTPYDLTTGAGAGPWGDPTRWETTYQGRPDLAPELDGSDEILQVKPQGPYFERAISIFRTAYSTACCSKRGETPVLWFAPGTPHASTFVPLYVARGARVPEALATGHMLQRSERALWWYATLVSNWMRCGSFKFVRADVAKAQRAVEHAQRPQQRGEFWAKARADDDHVDDREPSAAATTADLDAFNNESGTIALTVWRSLFDKLVVKYRDGFHVTGTVQVALTKYFYSASYLATIGYWHPHARGFDEVRALDQTPKPAQTPSQGQDQQQEQPATTTTTHETIPVFHVAQNRAGPGTVLFATSLLFVALGAFSIGRATASKPLALLAR